MANHSKFSILGVTLVTPVLTAGSNLALALVLPTNVPQVDSADLGAATAEARLKTEILELSPSEKFRIAGARVPLLQLAANVSKGPAISQGNLITCAPHCLGGPPPRQAKPRTGNARVQAGAVRNRTGRPDIHH
jgi:hypothetical protein